MKRLLISLLLVFPLVALLLANAQQERRFRIMEYNCENLFDTCHDYGKADEEFLPDGANHWDGPRYWKKQGNLARVILEAGGLQPVDLIALCEVENDSVLADLTRRTRLASLGYDYAVSHSDDVRGIDVGLLYQPYTFRLLTTRTYAVPYDPARERPTRDVLHCTGVIPTGDTLDVLVVHFPSRRGGVRATSAYRLRAAEVVARVADSISAQRHEPALIVMGDCNDTPSDPSLRRMGEAGLVSQSAEAKAQGSTDPGLRHVAGTYYFQHEWSRIDHILVSRRAVERYHAAGACIFAPDYLLETDANGFLQPYRLYRGPAYHGGVSDHLPLLLDLWY